MAIASMDLWTAFLLGLVGSLHCAGMCGPLALALPAAGNTTPAYVLGRVAYNSGRIVTYCLHGHCVWAGGLDLPAGRAAALGLDRAGRARSCSAFSPRASWPCARPVTSLVNQLKSRMSVLLRRRSFTALAVLGLLNGLLPCGLVYVACAGAAATGGMFAGGTVYGRVRRRHGADDAGDQSLREAGPDSAAPQAA